MHPDRKEFFEGIYWDNENRIIKKRELKNDEAQWSFNQSRLDEEKALEKNILASGGAQDEIYFLVGVPRSGTTLLAQLMLNAFEFGAFYNSIAKYYSIPLVGLKELLDNREDLSDSKEYTSELGHVKGDFASHEFGYFWQYWLNHKKHDQLTEAELEKVNWQGLRNKLLAFSSLLNKKLLIKSLVQTNFIVERLAKEIPEARFIYLRREPEFVVQSILESRVKQYGTEDHWWSIRPKLLNDWKSLSNIKQVAHQVIYTDLEIRNQLETLEPSRSVEITYEDLVGNCASTLKYIAGKFNLAITNQSYEEVVQSGNEYRFSETKTSEIKDAVIDARKIYDSQ